MPDGSKKNLAFFIDLSENSLTRSRFQAGVIHWKTAFTVRKKTCERLLPIRRICLRVLLILLPYFLDTDLELIGRYKKSVSLTCVASFVIRSVLSNIKTLGANTNMIPSNRWFPSGWQDRAAWFQNFTLQFAAIGPGLGFTPAEITEVEKDNLVIQFLAEVMVQIDSFDDGVREYRRIITSEAIGKPTPNFPANPAFVHPGAQPTGIFERLDKLRTRIMAAANYTTEDGALLRILTKAPDPISPTDVKPSIKVSAAQTGYLFSIIVEKREKSDMWDVLMLKKGASSWQTVKTATGKSIDVTVSPTTVGEAEQIQVRVQLKLRNQNYGQPSDIVYVTVNP